jgi:dCTP deaminase
MCLNDRQIIHEAENNGMITPFVAGQVRDGIISYGTSSFGYDCRLGTDFKLIKDHGAGLTMTLDPKNVKPYVFTSFQSREPFLLPPHSHTLGVSLERFKIPADISGHVIGKSTYARCGVIINVTPLEPEWEGHITIEIANISPVWVRIYPGEGIMQVLFALGDRPDVTYANRPGGPGKYQGQGNEVVLPRM